MLSVHSALVVISKITTAIAKGKEKSKNMKKRLFKGKSKRTKIFTAITFACVLVVIALNLILTYFGVNRNIFLDMTPEGLYTLSDEMVDVCDEIFDKISQSDTGNKVKITFCSDPDYLIASELARATYLMAINLQNRYPEAVDVETVNVNINPTAVSQYKTTSLTSIKSTDVIISYGRRYVIRSHSNFWASGKNEYDHYNGEYKMVSSIKSVSAVERPAAYFVTDFGTTYYDPQNPDSEMSKSMSAFAGLLVERGLEVKTLELSSVEKNIPEDCVLLIINNPTKDFEYDKDAIGSLGYVSDIEKIDRYLVNRQGALAVAKDYEVRLPAFETFLYEWGFTFSDSIVCDEESSLADNPDGEKTGTTLSAVYNTDPDSYAYTLYGQYSNLYSAPLTVVTNSGSVECSFGESASVHEDGAKDVSRNYVSLLETSDKAQKYYVTNENGDEVRYVDGAPGKQDLAGLCIRSYFDSISKINLYSYVFCVNSTDFFENSLIGEPSYANYDIVSAVVDKISRVDDYASLNLGGSSINSTSIGGKLIIPMNMTELGEDVSSNKLDETGSSYEIIKTNRGISTTDKIVYSCFIFAVPAAAAVVGIVVSVKRRYL